VETPDIFETSKRAVKEKHVASASFAEEQGGNASSKCRCEKE